MESYKLYLSSLLPCFKCDIVYFKYGNGFQYEQNDAKNTYLPNWHVWLFKNQSTQLSKIIAQDATVQAVLES
jgi:hypothetical protein